MTLNRLNWKNLKFCPYAYGLFVQPWFWMEKEHGWVEEKETFGFLDLAQNVGHCLVQKSF